MPDNSVPKADRAAKQARPSDEVSRWVADYHAVLYRYAYRLSGSVPDAEDLTQQTFLIAQRKREQVRDATKVRAWLFTVLRSCFLKSLRKKTPIAVGDMTTELELTAGSLPREAEVDGELLQAVLNELADDFRLVLAMFYFEDFSYKEIAQQLEIPIGTVMSRLARGKTHLRQLLLAREAEQEKMSNRHGKRPDSGDERRTPAVH